MFNLENQVRPVRIVQRLQFILIWYGIYIYRNRVKTRKKQGSLVSIVS